MKMLMMRTKKIFILHRESFVKNYVHQKLYSLLLGTQKIHIRVYWDKIEQTGIDVYIRLKFQLFGLEFQPFRLA